MAEANELPGHVFFEELQEILRTRLPSRCKFCSLSVAGSTLRTEVIISMLNTREALGTIQWLETLLHHHFRLQPGSIAIYVSRFQESEEPTTFSLPRYYSGLAPLTEVEQKDLSGPAARLIRTQHRLPKLLGVIENLLEQGPRYSYRLLREHAMRTQPISYTGALWPDSREEPSVAEPPLVQVVKAAVPCRSDDLQIMDLAGNSLCFITVKRGDTVQDLLGKISHAIGPGPLNMESCELTLSSSMATLDDSLLLASLPKGEKLTLLRWVSLT